MMVRPSPIRVTAAIIRRPGQVLLARRQPGTHLAGRWEFPGGKVEAGESPEECLARELREEFGVGATVGRFITSSSFAYDDKTVELLAYEVELAPGPWALDSHDEVGWVRLDDLLGYELAPADIPIAELIIQQKQQERDGQNPAAARKRS